MITESYHNLIDRFLKEVKSILFNLWRYVKTIHGSDKIDEDSFEYIQI